jgi:hypothetical protein
MSGTIANVTASEDLDPSLRDELRYLDELEAWIPQRRAWLERYGAQAQAAPAAPPPGTPAQDPATWPTPQRPASSFTVGGFLLSLGAFALVAAGVVFAGFAWGALGAVGRFILLVSAGLLAHGAAQLAAKRIRATAITLAIVGTLLIAVANVLLLTRPAGDLALVRSVVAVAFGIAGIAAGRAINGRLRGAAVVTSLTGAFLVLGSFGTWVSKDVVDVDGGWYATALFVLWGLALIGLGLIDRTMPWAWLGTAGIVVGVLVGTARATDRGSFIDLANDPWAVLLLVAGLVVPALVLLALDRLLAARTWALPVGAVALSVFATLAAVTGASDPQDRGWVALALLVIAAVVVATAAHVAARPERPVATMWSGAAGASGARAIGAWSVLVLVVGALATVLAAGQARPNDLVSCIYGECTPEPEFVAWLREAYPWWRGVLAALAALALAVVVDAVSRRRLRGSVLAPWVAVLGVVGTWSLFLVNDTSLGSTRTDDAPLFTLALAWLITGTGLIGLVAWRGWVPGSVWVGGVLALAGMQLAWVALDAGEGWAVAPEVHGLLLAAPLLLAGMVHVLLEPAPVPTWISVGPALTAALVPTTLAVVGDTLGRWFGSVFGQTDEPGTAALVRLVALAAVTAVLAVVGGRRGWAGVFWPGVVGLAIVVVTQLIEVAQLVPAWIALTVVGLLLVGAGARWEQVRLSGRRTRQWAAALH